MAELDYAFLADFAQVENGRLTAVGASFTHAQVDSLNQGWIMSVAGRVRTTEGAAPVGLRIEVGPESEFFMLRFEDELVPDAKARAYGSGTVGVLFAALVSLPLMTGGLYVCRVFLDDVLVRRLAFEVEVAASAE